jgi:hypothetical protein
MLCRGYQERERKRGKPKAGTPPAVQKPLGSSVCNTIMGVILYLNAEKMKNKEIQSKCH